MKTTKMIVTGLLIAALLGGAVFAHDSDVLGRDVVSSGSQATLSGTLTTEDEIEWSLRTDAGTYVLHLGPPAFRDELGIGLRQGKAAVVTGYVQGKDVAPVSVTVDERRFDFRDESGRPMWAGTSASRGMGWNRKADESGNRTDNRTGRGMGRADGSSQGMGRADGGRC